MARKPIDFASFMQAIGHCDVCSKNWRIKDKHMGVSLPQIINDCEYGDYDSSFDICFDCISKLWMVKFKASRPKRRK